MTDLATLVVKLEAQTAAYQKGLQQAQSQLKDFQGSVEGIFDNLKNVAIEFIGAAALTEFFNSITEGEQQLEKLSIQTGVAVDELSKLQYAAKQNDVENFAGDIKKLSKSIGEASNGNEQLLLDFKAIGVSAADLKNLSIDQVLKKVADGFAQYADGAGKAAATTALMGRGGQDLIAFLNQGSAGIEAYEAKLSKLGGVTTPEAAEQAHLYGQALNDLKEASEGVGRGIITTLQPALTSSLEALAEFISATKDTDQFSPLTAGIKIVATAVVTLVYAFETAKADIDNLFVGAGTELGAYGAAFVQVLHGNFSQANDILKTAHQDLLALDDKYHADEITRDDVHAKALHDIWAGQASDQKSIVDQQYQNVDGSLKLLQGPASLKIGDAASIKALQDAIAGLQSKAKDLDLSASLDNTNEAMARVSLSTGKLRDDVIKAGEAGPKLAAQYMAAAKSVDEATANLSLSKLTQDLTKQLATFNGSKSAIDAYTLSTGVLGKQIKALGPDGATAVQQILNLDKAFEALQDQQGLIQIQAQVEKLGNDTAKSAGLLFDLQNQKLRTNQQDIGDAAGEAQLDHLKQLTVVQAQYNDLQKQASDIQSDYAIQEDAINRAVAGGQVSEIEGQTQLNTLHLQEVTALTGVQTSLQAITDQYGKDIPDLITKTNQFKNSIANVQSSTNELAKTFRTDFIDDADRAWEDFVTGAKSASDALKEFLDDFAKQILQMADKNLLEKLFQVNGQDPSQGIGGIFDKLAGLFTGAAGSGGGLSAGTSTALGSSAAAGADAGLANAGIYSVAGLLAGGGPADAGKAYVVGEDGPEVMVPKTAGTVVPNAALRGMQVTQNISIVAPKGTVSKETQNQVGASAYKSLALANRRNG